MSSPDEFYRLDKYADEENSMYIPFESLVGKTLASVEGAVQHSDVITLKTTDGETYSMFHEQDCCEGVSVEDVCGDINDLINSPILKAEEATSGDPAPGQEVSDYESFTWTFYRLLTAKGLVVIRWYGSSNGYYSESVTFQKGDS